MVSGRTPAIAVPCKSRSSTSVHQADTREYARATNPMMRFGHMLLQSVMSYGSGVVCEERCEQPSPTAAHLEQDQLHAENFDSMSGHRSVDVCTITRY